MTITFDLAEIEQLLLAGEIDPIPYVREGVQRIEEALTDFAGDPATNHPRRRLHARHADGRQVRINAFVGYVPSRQYIGAFLRCDQFFLLADRVQPSPPEDGKGFYILYSAADASALAVIHATTGRQCSHVEAALHMRALRTAATSVAGTRALARKGVRSAGLFGSGYFAASHLLALRAALPIERVKVYSRTPAHRRDFATEMGRFLGIDVIPVDEPEQAVRGVDVVMSVTSTTEPVVLGRWLEPGQHVTCIVAANKELGRDRREVDDQVIARSSRVAVTSRAQFIQDDQATLRIPMQNGCLQDEDVVEIGQILKGDLPGRTDDQEITFFHNNAGQGVTDVAMAGYAYELALRHGIGKPL